MSRPEHVSRRDLRGRLKSDLIAGKHAEKFQATGLIKAIRIRTLCGPTEREFARQWAFMSRRIGVPREVLKHLAFCTQLVAETPALLEVSLNTRLHRLLHGPPQSRWVPEVYTISDHLNLAACWLILASHLEASALGKPA